jgi:hypothetical protein
VRERERERERRSTVSKLNRKKFKQRDTNFNIEMHHRLDWSKLIIDKFEFFVEK